MAKIQIKSEKLTPFREFDSFDKKKFVNNWLLIW